MQRIHLTNCSISGVIPVVNENDTVSTYEMQFGDNDTLSALVASMVGGRSFLILLSDIDGLYTDDPHKNPEARLLKVVDAIDENIYGMAKRIYRQQCRNRRDGNKTCRSKDCNIIRNGYDHCKWRGCPHPAGYFRK